MEMWLKRSTLVLLTAALVISDQALVILDEKRSTEAVKVPHGSSVTFQCRLKTGAHDTFRVICEERGTYNGSRELHARRPVDVDHVGGFFGHPDCPAGRVCLADKKAPPKQRRRSNLRKHSSCGQQAAFSSAGDGPPKGGFFLSKPPEPESRQEVRRRQAEIQIMKKSRINSSSSHLVKACVHCTES
ncbi:uncharacterized protein [Cebidichthys violaceus]|uniref:uncharacterized protein isoform X10 n=1 Tax=Cebidichthys violaceus TaxID=271503 RepID=UPI0035C98D61